MGEKKCDKEGKRSGEVRSEGNEDVRWIEGADEKEREGRERDVWEVKGKRCEDK